MRLPAYLPDLSVMENAPPLPVMAAVEPASVFQLPSIGSAHAAPAIINVAASAKPSFRNMFVLLRLPAPCSVRLSAHYANEANPAPAKTKAVPRRKAAGPGT